MITKSEKATYGRMAITYKCNHCGKVNVLVMDEFSVLDFECAHCEEIDRASFQQYKDEILKPMVEGHKLSMKLELTCEDFNSFENVIEDLRESINEGFDKGIKTKPFYQYVYDFQEKE